jgi:hypothetical protein
MPERLARARRLFLACAVVAFWASPASAYYEESHVTGDEARISVDANGSARIEHVVSWHLVAGQLHFFDVTVLDPALSPETEASATAEDGRVYSATLVPREGNVLRVAFEEPKGLRHGRYKIRFAYREDLAATHAFTRDGAMWRLAWTSPSFSDGYDGAKVTFVLPAAVDLPRIAADADVDPGILFTVRVRGDTDEIELVKPHVARREAQSFSIRVAPRAFPGVRDPSLRPSAARPPQVVKARPLSPILLTLAALAAGLLYAALVWKAGARFDRACRELGVRAHGLVRLGLDMRAALAGALLGMGVLVEVEGFPTWGGAFIAVAMLMAVLRAPMVQAAPRGPGRWLALRPEEAFESEGRRRWVAMAQRVFLVLVTLGALAATTVLLHRLAPHALFVVALDAFAVIPVIATGRRSQLPPSARRGASWLHKLWSQLSKEKTLRVAPWARVPTGCTEPDEVRVLVLPRTSMPGLTGIEVGTVTWPSATCYGSTPEVLIRVHESTAASARMTTLLSRLRPVPGRVPEERVYRLVPRIPTRHGTALLVRRLGRELEDRRNADLPWAREERRLPPTAREKPLADAA